MEQIYFIYEDGKADGFKKFEEDLNIEIFSTYQIRMTIAEFTTISNILSQIGGFRSSIFLILTVLSGFFFKIFLKNLSQNIKEMDQSNESTQTIIGKVKDRLSYYGLYNLYDQMSIVETITKQNTELIKNLEQKDQQLEN